MRIWPILLDSRPEFLGESANGSLLLLDLATGTVAQQLASWVKPLTRNAPLVLPPKTGATAGYMERIAAACPDAQIISSPEACIDALARFEPSDTLLILDPSCLPTDGADLEPLVRRYAAEPRIAHHLIAFESGVAGTKERVNFDAAGRVRGIARHYEPATWPFISGVFATLLPVASGLIGDGVIPTSLVELRRLLVARGVPSHDVPVQGMAFDCTDEKGFLAASEQFVLQAAAIDRAAAAAMDTSSNRPILMGTGHTVAPTARIIGPVIIHAGARVGEHATIFGPASIGAGATVGDRAMVAHAAVAGSAVVAAGGVVRDRVWVRGEGPEAPASPAAAGPSYRDYLSRLVLDVPVKSAPRAPRAPKISAWDLRLKRLLDIVASGVSLILLSPFFAIAAVLVKLDSKGPVFYGDIREGRGGRGFKCWKFRTMSVGAHAVQKDLKGLDRIDGPHFKLDRDPRVTRIGRILRATNADELPQLFNVLVGEMSLVGPRPSPFRENQICVPWREARISVRPGITGLWQVARHDRAAGDFHQWIEYDLLYVQHCSFWLDVKILAATVLTAGGKAGHVPASRLIRLPPAGAIAGGTPHDVENEHFESRRIA